MVSLACRGEVILMAATVIVGSTMSAMQFALILGPGLAVTLLIAYLTRNDPITARSIEQAQQSPFNRLSAVLSCISGPIAVLVLINNLFGAFLLIIGGAIFIFQHKLYPHVFWIRGKAAILIGLAYLASGVYLTFHHVSII